MKTVLSPEKPLPLDPSWEVPEFEATELKPRTTRYCVMIPVINEGERLINQLASMQRLQTSLHADVVILDGGSTDGSIDGARLRALGVRAFLVKKGSGKLSAQLRMGFAWALCQGYQGVITVDGNGKDGLEAVPAFVRELERGADFVQGSRYVEGGQAINTPVVRTLAIKLLHAPFLSLIGNFRYTDTTNGFRGFSAKYLTHDEVKPFRAAFDTYELLAYMSVRAPQLGLKTKEIPVVRRYPDSGEIPTKISHFHGNLLLLKILWRTAIGEFNPK